MHRYGSRTPGDLNAGNINFSIRNIKCNVVGCENIPLHTDVCIWIQKHSRNGGWNKGTYAQTDTAFTVEHDRDVSFLVDKADVDETNATASIQNISKVFEQTQVVPETDALFFSKVAQAAQKVTGYHSSTASSDYTKANVFSKLKGFLAAGKLRRYKANGSLIMYVSSAIMDLLELSTEFNSKIEMTQIAEGGMGIENTSHRY